LRPGDADTNNLSLVLWLNVGGVVSFLFPGDLERPGWKSLHESNPTFRAALAATDILVASHHGRDSGIHHEIFSANSLKPRLIVISDKPYEHETQETVGYYYCLAQGANFKKHDGSGTKRFVLTTRSDNHLVFTTDTYMKTWTVESAGFNLFDLLALLSTPACVR
jgi:beta-lactamase superfamily II metal-dependent hydrolase